MKAAILCLIASVGSILALLWVIFAATLASIFDGFAGIATLGRSDDPVTRENSPVGMAARNTDLLASLLGTSAAIFFGLFLHFVFRSSRQRNAS